MHIRIACSPDADDLFMMRALWEGLIDTKGYTFTIDTIETDRLNQLATGDGPHVSAMSIAWYPKIAEFYQLLPHGGSMGEGYGPVLVSKTPMSLSELGGKTIAVPGLTTSAYAVLRQMIEGFQPVVTPITPYARIFESLRDGVVDAGLVIHEGRLTYEQEGFVKVADLGEWWATTTGLPLPLGGNVIRRDLGAEMIWEVSSILKASIAHALTNRDQAISWLMARGGALKTRERISEYLSMYANDRTLDYGKEGRDGIALLLSRLEWHGSLDFAPA